MFDTKASLPRRAWRALKHAVERRPHRVWEAVVAVGSALGYTVDPELGGHVLWLAGAAVLGSEWAQRHTTSSKHPIFVDDAEADGDE